MNNKEKQIEEMAKVICQECLTATEEKECLNNVKDCLAYDYAKIFYNAGYTQKVNKGDVVLTKENIKKYAKDCIAGEETGLNIINGLIARSEQTRKETAREILQEVRNLCKEQADRFSHLCKTKKEAREETLRYEGVLAVKNRLGKIAEKYGVEVEW